MRCGSKTHYRYGFFTVDITLKSKILKCDPSHLAIEPDERINKGSTSILVTSVIIVSLKKTNEKQP